MRGFYLSKNDYICNMKNIVANFLKKWWKRIIVDVCPKELEDTEFSEKYRTWRTKKPYQKK